VLRRTRPVVLFVDAWWWGCFLELAGLLRGAGVRTVCVVPQSRPSRFLSGWLCYGTTLSLDRARSLRRLERLVRSGRVLDVQLNELCVRSIAPGSPGRAVLDTAFPLPAGSRWQLADKLTVSSRLAAAGVFVPPFARLEGDYDDAVAALGWPLLVKRRISCGGAGIRIARDRESLAAAIDSLSEGAGVGEPQPPVFAERLLEGDVLQYNAVVGPDGVEQELCARGEKSASNPFGPSLRCVPVDDPSVRAAGRKAVGVLGCTGLVQLEFIRAPGGTPYLTDVNPRSFGNISALAEAGVDLMAGYLHWLGATGRPPVRPARMDSRLDVFLPMVYEQLASAGLLRTGRSWLRELRRRRTVYGPRYAFATALILAKGTLKGAWDGPPPPARPSRA